MPRWVHAWATMHRFWREYLLCSVHSQPVFDPNICRFNPPEPSRHICLHHSLCGNVRVESEAIGTVTGGDSARRSRSMGGGGSAKRALERVVRSRGSGPKPTVHSGTQYYFVLHRQRIWTLGLKGYSRVQATSGLAVACPYKSLNSKKAMGSDQLTAAVLKPCAMVHAPSVATLVNASMSSVAVTPRSKEQPTEQTRSES